MASFFPNANYVRRSAHAHAHKYSVREIAKFASNREYTALAILMEAHHAKVPDGLDIVLLPEGPHFHFSISNWVEGKKLPGHGKDQGYHPELVLNGESPKHKAPAYALRNDTVFHSFSCCLSEIPQRPIFETNTDFVSVQVSAHP